MSMYVHSVVVETLAQVSSPENVVAHDPMAHPIDSTPTWTFGVAVSVDDW